MIVTALSTTIELKSDMHFDEFIKWEGYLSDEEFNFTRFPRDRKLVIWLPVPDEFTNAPPGTHDYAAGFITALKLVRLADALGIQRLFWKDHEVVGGRLMLDSKSQMEFEVSRFGHFRKIKEA